MAMFVPDDLQGPREKGAYQGEEGAEANLVAWRRGSERPGAPVIPRRRHGRRWAALVEDGGVDLAREKSPEDVNPIHKKK